MTCFSDQRIRVVVKRRGLDEVRAVQTNGERRFSDFAGRRDAREQRAVEHPGRNDGRAEAAGGVRSMREALAVDAHVDVAADRSLHGRRLRYGNILEDLEA